MKIVTMIVLSFFLSRSCDKQLNEEMKKSTIEYQALSRGYFLNITIQDEKLSIIDKRDGKSRDYKLTKRDWKELADLYKFVKVEKIPTYKAPTEKRFYDGAAIATLRITYDGKTYETEGFDHEYPPLEIKKFVDKIVSFAKK
jgi:hypothetical protein